MTTPTGNQQSSCDVYTQRSSLFGFPPPLSSDSLMKRQPTSAPTSLKRHPPINPPRPESMKTLSSTDNTATHSNLTIMNTAESQLLDKWSEDLQQYEKVLNSLLSASLDSNVKEEIKHVDQWFQFLGETERTATIYALLQHSTPVQIRFFITVLQQLGKQDPISLLLSPVYPENDTPRSKTNSKNRHSYAFGDMNETTLDRYTSSSPPPRYGAPPMNLSNNNLASHLATDSSRWSSHHDSPNTGLRTGVQQGTPRPKSADISHWSFGASSSLSSSPSTRVSMNDPPVQISLLTTPASSPPPGQSTFPMSTRVSWHGSVPALKQFSDAVFPSSMDPVDALASNMNRWSLDPSIAAYQKPVMLSNDMHSFRQRRQQPHHHTSVTMDGAQVPESPSSTSSPSPSSTSAQANDSNKKYMFPLYYDQQHFSRNDSYLSKSDRYSANTFINDSTLLASQQPKERHYYEEVNTILFKDTSAWLKSLRLHKYNPIFEAMPWQEMIVLTDNELLAKGVVALGARRKFLKLFDQVKQYCQMNNIKHK